MTVCKTADPRTRRCTGPLLNTFLVNRVARLATGELFRSATESPGSKMPETLPESRGWFWLHRWQINLFLVPVIAIALVGWRLYQSKPEYVRLLWTDPLGLRMSVGVTVWMLTVAVVCLAGTAAVNRSAARAGWSAGRSVLVAGFLLAWAGVGCLPALHVILVGPAAVQIQRGHQVGSGVGSVVPAQVAKAAEPGASPDRCQMRCW
jgi:hypothetical protein